MSDIHEEAKHPAHVDSAVISNQSIGKTSGSENLVLTSRGLIKADEIALGDYIIRDEFDLLKQLKREAVASERNLSWLCLGLMQKLLAVKYHPDAEAEKFVWTWGSDKINNLGALCIIRRDPPKGLVISKTTISTRVVESEQEVDRRKLINSIHDQLNNYFLDWGDMEPWEHVDPELDSIRTQVQSLMP